MSTRTLLLLEKLPERKESERLVTLRADVKDAMLLVRSKLTAAAARYHTSGRTEASELEYDVNDRTIVGRLVLTRDD